MLTCRDRKRFKFFINRKTDVGVSNKNCMKRCQVMMVNWLFGIQLLWKDIWQQYFSYWLDRYVPTNNQEDRNNGGSSRTKHPINDVLSVLSCHCEAVVLLSRKSPDSVINVKVEFGEISQNPKSHTKWYRNMWRRNINFRYILLILQKWKGLWGWQRVMRLMRQRKWNSWGNIRRKKRQER